MIRYYRCCQQAWLESMILSTVTDFFSVNGVSRLLCSTRILIDRLRSSTWPSPHRILESFLRLHELESGGGNRTNIRDKLSKVSQTAHTGTQEI